MYFFKPCAYIDYTPPKLSIGKSWCIYYYVKSPYDGKKKRVRMKINHIGPPSERRKAARIIIAHLTEKLAMGWNPFVEQIAPKSGITIFEALDDFMRIRSKEMEKQSISSYKSYIKVFKDWLIKSGFSDSSLICTINKEVALAFLNSLDENEKISARTYNNYLSFLSSTFIWLQDHGYIGHNIFADFKKKPKKLIKKTRKTLTNEELLRLINFLRKENKEYLAICLLCYCCFIRPKEIALLKCRDINLQQQTIFVSKFIAKNDNDSYRTIPSEIIPILKEIDLSHPDYYAFGGNKGNGEDFRSSPQYLSHKKIADYWARVVRNACGFPMELQFYSLKDTGITNMLRNGIPISFVQQQADHSSVAMTAIYVSKVQKVNEKLKEVQMFDKNDIIR